MNNNTITDGAQWMAAMNDAHARGPVTAEELAAFVAFLSARLYTDSSAQYPDCQVNWREAVAQPGRKFARIVSRCPLKDSGGRNYHASAYCFVDLANGDILKTAGWNAPAKHARGNIRVGTVASFWNGALTPFGAAYLK